MSDAIDEAIERALFAPTAKLWDRVWRKAVDRTLVKKACDSLDPVKVTFHEHFAQLDDERFRRKVLSGGKELWEACADELVAKESKEAIDAFLKTSGCSPVGKAGIRKRLLKRIATDCHSALRNPIIAQDPFPRLWPAIADEFARRLFAKNHPAPSEEQWQLLNQLILIGYFRSCRAPKAELAKYVIEQASSSLLGVRGAFIRIPMRISNEGLADPPLTLATSSGPLSLQHRSLTTLLDSVESSAADVAAGQGFVFECLRAECLLKPPKVKDQYRKAAGLFEHSLLSYMAVTASEQLLRTLAEQRGVPHLRKGNPDTVANWYGQLEFDAATEAQIKTLFDPNGPNIRNNIMHGNLLEIDSKWIETRIPIDFPHMYEHSFGDDDPYQPENLSRMALNCLSAVDQSISSTTTLGSADLQWTSGFELSAEEVEFGRRLHNDLFSPDGDEWLRLLEDYLQAVMPSLKQLYFLGMIGWLDGRMSPSLPRFTALIWVFETLYRLTCHLLGESVLQEPYSTRSGDSLRFQHLMLEERHSGLCCGRIIDRIVGHIVTEQQDNARRAIKLAVRVRNSFSHGAIVTLDEPTQLGLGHLVIKATQALVTAGMEHMVHEAAYFRWQNRRDDECCPIDDWNDGYGEVSSLIRKHSGNE